MLERPAISSSLTSRNGSPLRPAFSSTASSFKPDSAGLGDDVHPIINEGRVAVITGAASGIGRAAALELAKLKLKIAIADVDEARLHQIGKDVAAIVGDANVLVVPTDVSKLDQVVHLKEKVYELWGEVAVLMNNAGIGLKGTSWDGINNWKTIFDVNLFGILNVQQTFVPFMLHQENQGMIINTGSKQGITNPPGNAAYNASKAAVKSLTESLAHELRERPNSNVTAHLFIPGWTYTNLTGALTQAEKPAGAWTAEETVLYMLDKVRAGDFYVLVPDNETRRELDELRIMWAAGDIAEGRPALSRWHKDYKALFEEYVRDGMTGVGAGSERSF
ncbi:NAD-P-binding protein [Lentinula lateritia]|uniref:NAD-P-binding protein n=1 Tax=Lentinula aff. lateritia TaxID=2804960 RepID=A0ACC1U5K5_9AGAR|nr:NAD-P-binding protein [Lentinula aff. lateritia]KAJ3855815.1 NAD-P-binding protein [Lentinula lateritia]